MQFMRSANLNAAQMLGLLLLASGLLFATTTATPIATASPAAAAQKSGPVSSLPGAERQRTCNNCVNAKGINFCVQVGACPKPRR